MRNAFLADRMASRVWKKREQQEESSQNNKYAHGNNVPEEPKESRRN